MGARLSMNYGFTCTCFTKVELVVSHRFPIVVESILDQRYWYGAKIKSTHSIPITDVSFPECYGNDMVHAITNPKERDWYGTYCPIPILGYMLWGMYGTLRKT